MKYKVSGTNRENGARMTLEFQASNRAMAERKAMHAGMGEVRHCEQQADPNSLQMESATHRGEFDPPRQGGKIVGLLVVIIVMVAAAYVVWRTTI